MVHDNFLVALESVARRGITWRQSSTSGDPSQALGANEQMVIRFLSKSRHDLKGLEGKKTNCWCFLIIALWHHGFQVSPPSSSRRDGVIDALRHMSETTVLQQLGLIFGNLLGSSCNYRIIPVTQPSSARVVFPNPLKPRLKNALNRDLLSVMLKGPHPFIKCQRIVIVSFIEENQPERAIHCFYALRNAGDYNKGQVFDLHADNCKRRLLRERLGSHLY